MSEFLLLLLFFLFFWQNLIFYVIFGQMFQLVWSKQFFKIFFFLIYIRILIFHVIFCQMLKSLDEFFCQFYFFQYYFMFFFLNQSILRTFLEKLFLGFFLIKILIFHFWSNAEKFGWKSLPKLLVVETHPQTVSRCTLRLCSFPLLPPPSPFSLFICPYLTLWVQYPELIICH